MGEAPRSENPDDRGDLGRVLRAVGASVLAFGAARALPAMPPAAGVLARGVTVMAVMTAILWLTRFFNPEELRALNALTQGAPTQGKG